MEQIVSSYDYLPAATGDACKWDTVEELLSKDKEYQRLKLSLMQVTSEYDRLNKELEQTAKRMDEIRSSSVRAGNAVKNTSSGLKNVKERTQQTAKSTEELSKKTQKLKSHASGTLKMIKSMLLSMLLFSAVSGIINAITEGMQNMAQGSENANGVLSRLSTSFLLS